MTEKSPDRLRLTAEDLDHVRQNLDWQAMFSDLGLEKSEKKSKPHDWWALSPFNEEKTPSFHMGDGGKWYDFSANCGGGAIELIQKLEGLNCFEAGQYIVNHGWSRIPEKTRKKRSRSKRTAQKTGQSVDQTIRPETDNPNQGTSENLPIRQDLTSLCQYHEVLETRGISADTAEALGIGYLGQGRSSLRKRIVFQVRDARPDKKDQLTLKPVILSHVGRTLDPEDEHKYLFYPGFQKSREILGQDRLWLNPEAIEQIKSLGFIILTEGPFDWAKAIEAGVHNVGAVFGSSLSEHQAHKIQLIAKHHGVQGIRLMFDRDEAGVSGATAARDALEALDLKVDVFDWEGTLAEARGNPVKIPKNIGDLADLEIKQIQWLRHKGWL